MPQSYVTCTLFATNTTLFDESRKGPSSKSPQRLSTCSPACARASISARVHDRTVVATSLIEEPVRYRYITFQMGSSPSRRQVSSTEKFSRICLEDTSEGRKSPS